MTITAEWIYDLSRGDTVTLSHLVRPKRLIGRTATVVRVLRTRVLVTLDVPDYRFRGEVACPANLLEVSS